MKATARKVIGLSTAPARVARSRLTRTCVGKAAEPPRSSSRTSFPPCEPVDVIVARRISANLSSDNAAAGSLHRDVLKNIAFSHRTDTADCSIAARPSRAARSASQASAAVAERPATTSSKSPRVSLLRGVPLQGSPNRKTRDGRQSRTATTSVGAFASAVSWPSICSDVQRLGKRVGVKSVLSLIARTQPPVSQPVPGVVPQRRLCVKRSLLPIRRRASAVESSR